jgi:hypothetical protein
MMPVSMLISDFLPSSSIGQMTYWTLFQPLRPFAQFKISKFLRYSTARKREKSPFKGDAK